ncbi:MAG: penicillin-binding protein [Bacteroidetes bacterium]|nr:penicillin-binding protein [Bacteroidota bacterium]MBT6686080.1 penicillin-binding protein [Bacteroidota bacterium]MBT7142027.1 penicillin-binding protein [Bacteroidota bacterium]MBT7493587.1 penicillin-binding protein [Bacteroidota bacterium]
MEKKKRSYRLYLWLMWLLFTVPMASIITIFILISQGFFGFMPTFEELENPKSNLASEIYSSDQKLLGKYYLENRSFVNYYELSPYLIDALVATEDIRFEKHSGIDIKALLRVSKGVLSGNSSGGGSTITQQLAKNLFPRDTSNYNSSIRRTWNLAITKFKEWVTAVKLERNYTKKEILVMYLNTVPFGSQAYGIKSASSTFFNCLPDSLKVQEAATLVGLLKAPTRYSPVRNPERSTKRRNVVLSQMKRYNFIDQEKYDSISVLPIELNYRVQTHAKGMATHFREYLRTTLNSNKPEKERYWSYTKFKEDSIAWETNALFGWCKKHFKPDGTNYNLYKDGIKIYTTLNSRLQQFGEESLEKHLGGYLQAELSKELHETRNPPFSDDISDEQFERIMERSMKNTDRYRELKKQGKSLEEIKRKFDTPTEMTVFSWNGDIDTVLTPLDSLRYYKFILRAGFMSMDPHTGHVKAYVGGGDYRYFKYDHVTQGKRQIGSTIKPFLYTLAMQEGYSPCYKVPNIPTTFYVNDSSWTPKNSSKSEFDGKMVSLKWGLANSVNYISAWVLKQFNPHAVVDITRKMGVKSYIDPVPSIFLGTSDVTLYEMVGAYSTFANKGVYTEPIFVTRIEDKNGNIVSTFKPKKIEAFNEETAYLMLNLLKGVVTEGSGRRLRWRYQLHNDIGGKTGTTDNHSDGWFMGVTQNLVSGVWVGGEVRSIHFKGLKLGQGANMALPIYGMYQQKVYADTANSGIFPVDFERPAKEINIELDCEKFNKQNQNEQIIDDTQDNEDEQILIGF